MASHRLVVQRFRQGTDLAQEAEVWMEAGQIAARQGRRAEARGLVQAAIQARPDWAEAWLWLAWLTEDRRERQTLLRQVLTLEPEHAQARAELARLERRTPGSRRPAAALRHRWIAGLLTLLVMLLLAALLIGGPVAYSLARLISTPTPTATPTPTLTPAQIVDRFVPRLQAALASQNWERAAEIVAIMEAVEPSGAEARHWALVVDRQHGQALVQAGQIRAALEQFDQAVALAPDDEEARLWQQSTRTYLEGQRALQAGDWATAIQAFAQVQAQMPTYADVAARLAEAYCRQAGAALEGGNLSGAIETLNQARQQLPDDPQVIDLLAQAYRQRGLVREEEGQLEQARSDLETALLLRPGDAEAQAGLDRVLYRLFPPRRIEIDISQQHLYAWEGDRLVYSFPISTGLPGQDTATGHFQILDKLPMAYSSVWRLKMPYWLGIYYVDNIENGIHALPIRPDGSVMWAGLLGQRASYGCVILSTEAARLIYDWAEIGLPVDIHY